MTAFTTIREHNIAREIAEADATRSHKLIATLAAIDADFAAVQARADRAKRITTRIMGEFRRNGAHGFYDPAGFIANSRRRGLWEAKYREVIRKLAAREAA